MRLNAKLVSSFLLLLVVAIIAMSAIEADRALDLMVGELATSGDLIAKQVFEQMRAVLARSGGKDPAAALRRDASLQTLLDSSLAFGQTIVSVEVIDPNGNVIVAAAGQPEQHQSKPMTPIETIQRARASRIPLRPVPELWKDQVYGIDRPVEINGKRFATIEVGVSTALIGNKVHRMARAMLGALVAIVFLCALIVTLLGNYLLSPVKAITSGVEQLASGEVGDEVKLEVPGRDELSTLADKFNQLSQRVRSDRARWESERGHLFNAFRSTNDAVLLLDGKGSVLFANPEAQRRLGLRGGAVEGKSLGLLLGNSHTLVRMSEAALAAGTGAHDVAVELNNNGSAATRYLVSILPLGQGPEAVGLLIMMRDLAPMRELAKVVDYSSRLARLGGLISGVAHQIRNPLNTMTLQLELLRQDAESGRPGSERIDGIRAEIRRLDQAIDALLRFMRPGRLDRRELALNDLLTEIGRRVVRPNISVSYQLAADLPQITADKGLLQEAIKAVVENAVQSMPNGGTVTIGSGLSGDGFVEATVADQGPGIAAENLDHIFNLYFTTKDGGSGVGLSLALRAIDLHHGTINVQSKVGVGSTFTIRLPIDHEAVDLPSQPERD
ncbi:MAG: ATP-binding protein [Candidatus Binataceae bacterium]|jgi:signal transduction histidine kinase